MLIFTQKTILCPYWPRKLFFADIDPENYPILILTQKAHFDFIVRTAWKVPTFVFLLRSAAQTISHKIEIKIFFNSDSVAMELLLHFVWQIPVGLLWFSPTPSLKCEINLPSKYEIGCDWQEFNYILADRGRGAYQFLTLTGVPIICYKLLNNYSLSSYFLKIGLYLLLNFLRVIL